MEIEVLAVDGRDGEACRLGRQRPQLTLQLRRVLITDNRLTSRLVLLEQIAESNVPSATSAHHRAYPELCRAADHFNEKFDIALERRGCRVRRPEQ